MPSGATWQLQEAKAKLSEVVRRARTDGPQTITVHGERAVVVIAQDEYEQRLAAERAAAPAAFGRNLVEVLLNAPKLDMSDEEIDRLFERDRSDVGRDISFED